MNDGLAKYLIKGKKFSTPLGNLGSTKLGQLPLKPKVKNYYKGKK